MAQHQCQKDLRQKRKDNHECAACGKKLPEDATRIECDDCKAKSDQRYRNRVSKGRAAGLCRIVSCGQPASPGRQLCDKHRQEENDRNNTRRADLNARGLCCWCEEAPPEEGKQMCRDCLDDVLDLHDARKNRRAAAGMCEGCGKCPPAAGCKRCEGCLKKHRDYFQDLRREVLEAYGGVICVGCGDTRLEVLQLDHTDGSGGKHRKAVGNNNNMVYHDLRNRGFPPGHRVLCACCNLLAYKGLPFPNAANTPIAPTETVNARIPEAPGMDARANSPSPRAADSPDQSDRQADRPGAPQGEAGEAPTIHDPELTLVS